MTQRSRIKILLVGEPAVGKSSILQRYTMNRFTDSYSATILMDFYAKEVDSMMIDLWDLSGHPEFFKEREKFYEKSQIIIFVFDLTSRRTFDSLDMWIYEVNGFLNTEEVAKDPKPYFVLCGNKLDLGNYRVVPTNEAQYWAKSRNIEYFEVSALEGEGIIAMFESCSNKFREGA